MKSQVWLSEVGHSNGGELNTTWFTIGWFIDGIGEGASKFEYDRDSGNWKCLDSSGGQETQDFVEMLLEQLKEQCFPT